MFVEKTTSATVARSPEAVAERPAGAEILP
jgi:hypothetical protein